MTISISLDIYIAERSRERVHRSPDLNAWCIDSELDDILQCSGSAGWRVVQCDGSGDGILSVLEVLVLPDPPGAVDLCVVEEEGRVAGGREDVSAWVAADCEMSAGVHAVEAACEVALHPSLERADIFVVCDEVT